MRLHVNPKEILKAKPKDVQEVSWMILEQRAGCIEKTMHKDSAPANIGLNILEEALDWRIGLAFVKLMKACPKGKIPKPFDMTIKKNMIFAEFASEKKIQLEGR